MSRQQLNQSLKRHSTKKEKSLHNAVKHLLLPPFCSRKCNKNCIISFGTAAKTEIIKDFWWKALILLKHKIKPVKQKQGRGIKNRKKTLHYELPTTFRNVPVCHIRNKE